jgi:cation/acetate symporter
MIAQMVGAGGIVKVLIGVEFVPAVIGVGVLMLVYVVFGGMLATTWVQIIKAILLMGGAFALSWLVLSKHDFSIAKFFDAVSHADYAGSAAKVKNLLDPGAKYGAAVNPWGPLDFVSLSLGLVLGTAGLPHILVRFYTVRMPRPHGCRSFGQRRSSGFSISSPRFLDSAPRRCSSCHSIVRARH